MYFSHKHAALPAISLQRSHPNCRFQNMQNPEIIHSLPFPAASNSKLTAVCAVFGSIIYFIKLLPKQRLRCS